MSGRRRHEMIEVARRTVAEQLAEPDVRARLDGLPAGAPERIRRPEGPPSQWPDLVGSTPEGPPSAPGRAPARGRPSDEAAR